MFQARAVQRQTPSLVSEQPCVLPLLPAVATAIKMMALGIGCCWCTCFHSKLLLVNLVASLSLCASLAVVVLSNHLSVFVLSVAVSFLICPLHDCHSSQREIPQNPHVCSSVCSLSFIALLVNSRKAILVWVDELLSPLSHAQGPPSLLSTP